jgi:hypothetical protein
MYWILLLWPVASVNEPLTEGGKSFASIIGESHLFRIASLKEEILAEEDFQICQKKEENLTICQKMLPATNRTHSMKLSMSVTSILQYLKF